MSTPKPVTSTSKEKETYFCSTQQLKHKIKVKRTLNIALCSQLQYTKYTQLNVLNHNRRKRIQSQSMNLNSLASHLLPIEKAIYFSIMKIQE